MSLGGQFRMSFDKIRPAANPKLFVNATAKPLVGHARLFAHPRKHVSGQDRETSARRPTGPERLAEKSAK